MHDPIKMIEESHPGLFQMRDFVSDAKEAGTKLFLTGSRFFRHHNLRSDWDFFCQESINVRDHLTIAGFQAESGNGDYSDNITLDVWSGRIAGEFVHVQIVRSVKIKMAAQMALQVTMSLKHAEALLGVNTRQSDQKMMRRLLWNLALEAVTHAE